jgi:hypothetical protein
VLRASWEIYTRFFWRLLLLAAVIYAVLELLTAGAGWMLGSRYWTTGILTGLAAFLLGLIGAFWVQGATVEAIHQVREGRTELPVAELYRRVRPLLPALIGAGIAAACGIVFGLVLLIVPGLFLMTRWALIVPVIVLERRPAEEAFERSWRLVKGSSWRVFGLILLTLLALAAVSVLVNRVFTTLPLLPSFLATWIGGTVSNSLIVPLAATIWTVAYLELVREQVQPIATMMPPIQV